MKWIILLFLSCISAASAQYHADPYLAALWLFDKNQDNRIYNSKTEVNDGDFDSGTVERVTGKRGRAIEFYGGVEGNRICLHRSIELSSIDFTVGLWIKPRAFQNKFSTIFDFRSWNGGLLINQHGSWLNHYRIRIGGVYNSSGPMNARDGIKLPIDRWSHLLFLRKGDKGYWYLNGKRYSKRVILIGNHKAIKSSTKWPRIGASRWSDWRGFNGVIDELFIIQKALDPGIIKQIAQFGFQRSYQVYPDSFIAQYWGNIKRR